VVLNASRCNSTALTSWSISQYIYQALRLLRCQLCVFFNVLISERSHLIRVEQGTSSNSGSSVRDTRTVSPVHTVRESQITGQVYSISADFASTTL
jgi:hypothetical protein